MQRPHIYGVGFLCLCQEYCPPLPPLPPPLYIGALLTVMSDDIEDAICLPMTIKHIRDTVQSITDVQNLSASAISVRMVGRVVSMEKNDMGPTSIMLCDNTGVIEIRFLCSDMNAKLGGAFCTDSYIEVTGVVQQSPLSPVFTLVVETLFIRPVTDFNQITFHMLDCIYSHLSRKKSSGNHMTV